MIVYGILIIVDLLACFMWWVLCRGGAERHETARRKGGPHDTIR